MDIKPESLGKHFDKSFDFILENDSLFFDSFYANFMASSNLIKNAFSHTDMNYQKKMLRDSLKHLIQFFCTNKETTYLKSVARIHATRVRADRYMYKLFVDTFIETMEQTYPDFCDETALAWRTTLKPGIDYMVSYK